MIKDCAEAQSVKESGKNQTISLDKENGSTTGHEDDRKDPDDSKKWFLDQIRIVYKESMLSTLVIMAVGVLIWKVVRKASSKRTRTMVELWI